MSASSTWRLFGRTVLVALLAGTSSCGRPPRRIPLPVPFSAVGGSRPATPQGVRAFGEFGDGVWGQEQERAEIFGGGVGFALRDRIEFSVSGYEPTPEVPDNATTIIVRGKIRLGDFMGGRASVGIHVAHMTADRETGSVQDERLTAWDVALPVTIYPAALQFAGAEHRWGVYAAPRLVFQTFEDRLAGETTKGTLAAGLLGVVARWKYVAVRGEMNLAHTPSMGFGNTTFQGGWILLPMASVSLFLPIGDCWGSCKPAAP